MDYDDIEWEDHEGNISNITNSTSNQNDSFVFDENSLEFGGEEEDNNNESLQSILDYNNNSNSNENETDNEDAIEFEIDTNVYKKGKEKKVVKRVDTREKRRYLSLHKSVLALYLANFKCTVATLSNEHLNSILLSIIPKQLIQKYSNIYSVDNKSNISSPNTTTTTTTTTITTTTTTTTTRSKSKQSPTKLNTSNETKAPQVLQKECIDEIINWYTSTFEFDESILNSQEVELNEIKIQNGNSSKRRKSKSKSKPTKKQIKEYNNKKNILYNQILDQINERKLSKKIYAEVFYMVCNLFGFECRLVRPLIVPPPVPVTASKLKKMVSSTSAASKRSKSLPNISIRLNSGDPKVLKTKSSSSLSSTTTTSIKKKVEKTIESKSKNSIKGKSSIGSIKSRRSKKSISESEEEEQEEEEEEEEEDNDTSQDEDKSIKKVSPKKKKPVLSFDSTDEEKEKEDSDQMITKPVTKRQLAIQKLNSPTKRSLKRNINETDTESSDNEDKKKVKRSSSEPISNNNKPKSKSKSKLNSSNSNDSSSGDNNNNSNNNNNNKIEIENWVEYFNHDEKRWITIDIVNKEIDKPNEFEKYEDPYSYVVGYNQYLFRDITTRYTNNYIGSSLKRLPSAQSNYWIQLLCNIFNSDGDDSSGVYNIDNNNNNNNNSNEDIGLSLININNKNISTEKRKLLQEIIGYERKEKIEKESKLELPISFAQFKTHPIYILEKDIPKYAAPDPNEKAIGLFKDENKIYHRDQIKTLHTSDKWVQYGYMVRDGEQPVKVVKGRSKSNPTSLLYGDWQIDPYKPPIIGSDGIVPTNSFGNVYLFKKEMLPIGGVHLKGTGYSRVARKLNISIAPAVVGWDLGCRRSYPLIDGIIVAKENSKRLYNAWLADSTIRAQESRIKKEEEIKSRWRRFMKNLLINEYIKKTYSTNDNENTLNNLKPPSQSSPSSSQQQDQLNNNNNNNQQNDIQNIQNIINNNQQKDNLNLSYIKSKLNSNNNNNNNNVDNSVNKSKVKSTTNNNSKNKNKNKNNNNNNNNKKKPSPKKKKQILSFDSTDDEEYSDQDSTVNSDKEKEKEEKDEEVHNNNNNNKSVVSSIPITKRQLALQQELERKNLESKQKKIKSNQSDESSESDSNQKIKIKKEINK